MATTFGPALRDYRNARRASQARVAEILGVSKQYVSGVELGRERPLSFAQLSQVSRELGGDPSRVRRAWYESAVSAVVPESTPPVLVRMAAGLLATA